jgi:predicted dehydrogenase
MAKLRWGILGTGNIARQFAVGVNASTRGVLAAVGSRKPATADAFARTHGIPRALGSYDALIADDSYDALYVSTPNTLHHEWTIKALRAGKHVLCEKPISVTVAEAQEMFDVARQCGRVLIEAFMYLAHPQTHKALELIRSGRIGKVQLIRNSFCYRARKLEGNIRFDASLAGGALMDVGCYCLSFARTVTGEEPSSLQAFARWHVTGVDEQTSVIATFPSGAMAEFTVGMLTQADNAAFVCGDEGYLRIPVPWKPPAGNGEVILAQSAPPKQDNPGRPITAPAPVRFAVDDARDVYAVEADAFAACVLDSVPAFVSKSATMGNMRSLEMVREQIAQSRTF